MLYLLLYVITYLLLISFFFNFFNSKNIAQHSLTLLLNIIRKYTHWGIPYFLIFALSGLPPVGLFFIKINFIYYLMYNIGIFNIIIIFINLLLSMIFYLQIFNTGNKSIHYTTQTINIFKKSANNPNNSYISSSFTYNIYYLFIFLFFFNFFFIFFFCDFYLIINQYL